MRFLLSNHVAINGDDGIEAVPVRTLLDGEGVFVSPQPDTDVGRRFPEGGFYIAPLPGTVVARSAGMNCSLSMAAPAISLFSVWSRLPAHPRVSV